jgi:hypothetical protein
MVDEQGIRALRKTRAYRTSRRTRKKSVVDTSQNRDTRFWLDWSNVGPWYYEQRGAADDTDAA